MNKFDVVADARASGDLPVIFLQMDKAMRQC